MTRLEIEPDEAAALIERGAEVVDVREVYEREAGRIAGSRHVEMHRLAGAAETLPRDRPVIFYCRVGGRSGLAAEAFANAGWEAYNLRGGLLAWVADGLPLEPADGHVADH